MADINSFREKLQSLIAKFEKDKAHYVSKGYPEAQVRLDFLNPFFKALGWDIENKAQKPPHERDVIVELSPETTGRPDYNFRINGATKFFVEAKAPSVALDDINHILQAKSYAWSTKEVYFVVLTDFEEFRLYDASLKPNPKFPDEGLILGLKHTDYLNNIEKLWELSKERIEQGSLEALLPKDTKSKRLRIPPDKSFLEDLTEWRTELAKDLHKRNPEFDVKLLNDVVQKLLDRIIFIRIAEDRRIRPDKELMEIVALWKEEGKRKSIMSHLLDLFHEVNDDLNGDIFKPHACERADVDSNLIAEIIENLYFPKSRYRFDAIGVELLGSIYERYLGSTIRVTPQRVKVEEKPEVRKAGGVYYTPKYIVDYIVKNTVGKLIEGKTPKQIEKIKILDPACGSGSFLLGAYQYLLDYHLEYYRKHTKEAQTQFFDFYHKVGPEDLALPLRTKAMILRNNIFGVDIDPQAVEITMMSLYLKALEGERGMLPKKQHLLPPLSNNIKCGNSLIGYDILDQGNLFDDETKSRINPFDWNSKSVGFGEIMESGGFDVIIGNPPYVRIQAMKEWAPDEVAHYKQHYVSASKGNYDIYVIFVEKGLSLLNPKGRFGFILPHKFFQTQYGEPLRGIISKGKHLSEVVHFGDQQVFEGATTYTCLLLLDKSPTKKLNFVKVQDLSLWRVTGQAIRGTIPSADIGASEWNLAIGDAATIFNRLKKMPVKLKDIADIFVGLQTDADDVYILEERQRKDGQVLCYSKATGQTHWLEDNHLKMFVKGSLNVRRYELVNVNKRLIFPYKIVDGKSQLIDAVQYGKDFPLTWQYLVDNKPLLIRRNKGKIQRTEWYGYVYKKNHTRLATPKLLVPSIGTGSCFAADISGEYYFVGSGGGGGGGYGISLAATQNISYSYLLGLLNSALLSNYLKSISTTFRGGYIALNRQYIEHLPIRTIDFNNLTEKAIHDKLVSLVDRMLDLHKKKNALPPSSEREKIEREIAITDEKIDDIVYGLYGVTEEGKRIIQDSRLKIQN
ncbi:MAG: Eco57I restriction-modification methylase domain-containing protein [Nitrospirae bacterium]|nr:Eco57I restriction-modification methylase domain-containing protein [Nitrospirota bacterium]MBI3377706.1 Eco57I restriction-modification methylase domain-containing protein [Nitrospirota bacterium]